MCDFLYINYTSIKLILKNKYITFTLYLCLVNKELPHCIGFGSSKYGWAQLLGMKSSQVVLVVKNPPANAGDIRDLG